MNFQKVTSSVFGIYFGRPVYSRPDDLTKGVAFIGDRFISRDNKKLRDNVVKRKVQRLFALLGMLVNLKEFSGDCFLQKNTIFLLW